MPRIETNKSIKEIDCSYFEDLFDQNEEIIVITLLANKNFRMEISKCRSLMYIEDRLNNKKLPYIAIMRGQVWKSNVSFEKDKEDFYRLIGFSYTTNRLQKFDVPGRREDVWIYVIDGEPK